ncbi:MAG: hypothetical protein ACLPUO_25535 [Streptosporangiaceae bacterium]|jgi:hypothetical protein
MESAAFDCLDLFAYGRATDQDDDYHGDSGAADVPDDKHPPAGEVGARDGVGLDYSIWPGLQAEIISE